MAEQRPQRFPSFTQDESARMKELLERAATCSLQDWEIENLEGLLCRKAQDDFARGEIGALALIGLLAVIGAIADSLKKEKTLVSGGNQ